MYKTNNKNIFLVVMICLFFVLALAMSAVSAKDITDDNDVFTTSTEDVDIIKKNLNNVTVSVTDNELNIKNSALNNSKLDNDGGNVLIESSNIQNSILNFKNNEEIIIKNCLFTNTNISIEGATTVYLVNSSFINSNFNLSTTNLLTIDLILNKSNNVNLTCDHILAKGFIFVNDFSNLYINVIKTKNGLWQEGNDYYDYSLAFPKAYEAASVYNSNVASNQLIMVNGSSNATGYINGSSSYNSFFITFSSEDSIDEIEGAYNIAGVNDWGQPNFSIEYTSEVIKLPNGTIIEIPVSYINSYYSNNFNFYSIYHDVNRYDLPDYRYYIESINYYYDYSGNGRNLAQRLIFDMMLVYNETGVASEYGGVVRNTNTRYSITNKIYTTYAETIILFINNAYNDTYETTGLDIRWSFDDNDRETGNYISSLEILDMLTSKEFYQEAKDWHNTMFIFLYQNIEYVDENGAVLGTEDMNVFYSVLSSYSQIIPYSVIKDYYTLYGEEGILKIVELMGEISLDNPEEVEEFKLQLKAIYDEINQIIDEKLVGEFGINLWKTVVVPSDVKTDDKPGTGEEAKTDNEKSDSNSNNNQGNNSVNNEKSTSSNTKNTPVTKKAPKKADLAILKVKKVKSSNKKAITYKVTIKNLGSLKSGKTSLAFWHIRNNKFKTKVKVASVKALKAGQKVTLTVKYYADKSKHKFCHEHYFVVNPNKNIKESSYNNNMMLIKH